MAPRPHRLVRRIDADDGFTLIEVLIAAVILAIASLATFGVLSAATRNAARAQATQVALDKAQEEMEKLHALSYSELALTRTPERVADTMNPNFRVNGGNFAIKREPLSEISEMVVNGGPRYGSETPIEGGVVVPGPISFSNGNVSGQIYRYIVWRNDPTCPESEVGTEDFCPGKQDYKQLIVAVKLNSPVAQSAETNYIEVQSQVSNPNAQAQRSTQGDEPGPGGGGNTQQEEEEREREELEDETGKQSTGKAITAQQFFLSDTPCSATGTTTRQPITGDHLLHNSLGVCASGPQTGSETPGAPDALLREAPPDPAPSDESNPPLYDYSSDSYLDLPQSPETDKGVQVLHDDTAGCNYEPTSKVHPEAKIHRWVTDPMPREFKMTGTVTLEFYSRTLNEASYPGTVCVYLFDRHEEPGAGGGTKWIDTRMQDALSGAYYWTYSEQGNNSWPRTEWTKLRLTMHIALPKPIPTGDRLGVALSVDAGTTPADGIPIMYDHPNYPTRLEVETTTPFEEGN
ncbi:MAG TPA: type II secretion system protein [Solirubrobacterales bacterium]